MRDIVVAWAVLMESKPVSNQFAPLNDRSGEDQIVRRSIDHREGISGAINNGDV
jgi:hypothetical protein